MILWASLTVALLSLLPVHTWAEVVDSFQTCSQFFYEGIEPVGFDQNAKKICQSYEYGGYFYATLYSWHHRIPLYSAYKFNYDWVSRQDGRKSGAWFIEPQLSGFRTRVRMDKEKDYNLADIKDRQAINADYSNTGYDRGHLNPNSFQQSDDGRKATFTLTNSVPMDACFNRVQWKAWENAVKEILQDYNSGTAYLVTGAVPDSNNRIPKKGNFDEVGARDFNRVTVPTHIWTAVCYYNRLNKEQSFSFGYIGKNEPSFNIVGKSVRDLTEELSRLYNNNNLKIFKNDCFFSKKHKPEEMIKKLYKNVQQHLGDRVNVPETIMSILNTAVSFSNNEGPPAKRPRIKEVKVDLIYSDEQEWLMEMEKTKFVSGLACSLSRPISMSVLTGSVITLGELRRKRQTSEGVVCTLVPENPEGCTTSCLYREEDGVYYCSTGTTTIKCSPTYSDITVSGEKCRNGHTCGLHGNDYYWCYTDTDWGYCSPPLPLGVTKSGKRCSAKRNCGTYGKFTCETKDGEEEECCRRADRFSALNNRNCKPDSPCRFFHDGYFYHYLWCDTTDGTWDHCCTA